MSERQEIRVQAGLGLNAYNVVELMRKEESTWNAVNQNIMNIIVKLKAKWTEGLVTDEVSNGVI